MRPSRILTAGLMMVLAVPSCSGGDAGGTNAAKSAAPVTSTMPEEPSTPTTVEPSTTTTTAATTTTTAAPPPTWHGVGTPESRGIDSGLLADLVDHIASRYPDIDAVSIVRNGTVVLDAAFYPHDRETLHQVYSVTKSVVSTLIGIAIGEGLLAGVDVPVIEVLAGHAQAEIDDRKASMTIEDVLTMSTGLDCRGSYLYRWEGLGEMRASED